MINKFSNAKYVLDNHGVICFPTETVCGLGIYFDDVQAYHWLNNIKGKREEKPYTMMLGDVKDIEKYAVIDENAAKLISKYLPGPLTLLLKAKDSVPVHVHHNSGVVGIRVPNFPFVNDLINYLGKPLLVPSANRSNQPPMCDVEEIREEFKDEVGYYFNGHSDNQKPSTIVSLVDGVKIIREGLISSEDIFNALGGRKMKISIGSDHGGFEYKAEVIKHLQEKGYEVIDCGTYSKDSCHYPLFAAEAARKVASGEATFGVVICTSGEGVMITANKIKGVRCGMGYNDEVSRLMRQHNNANMISFSQSFMNLDDVLRRLDIFLSTKFEGGRHELRVNLIKDLEK